MRRFTRTQSQKLFLYRANKVQKYNPEDFTEYYWMDLGELKVKLEENEPAKSLMKYWVRFLTQV